MAEAEVVLSVAVSLDGYIADEAGGVDWLTPSLAGVASADVGVARSGSEGWLGPPTSRCAKARPAAAARLAVVARS